MPCQLEFQWFSSFIRENKIILLTDLFKIRNKIWISRLLFVVIYNEPMQLLLSKLLWFLCLLFFQMVPRLLLRLLVGLHRVCRKDPITAFFSLFRCHSFTYSHCLCLCLNVYVSLRVLSLAKIERFSRCFKWYERLANETQFTTQFMIGTLISSLLNSHIMRLAVEFEQINQ